MNKTQHDQQADDLNLRLELLKRKQKALSDELQNLQTELNKSQEIELSEKIAETAETNIEDQAINTKREKSTSPKSIQKKQPKSFNLEKFIGENLSNKIGIIIIIMGVAIGLQYSIEHQLISIEMRLVLGYIFSVALIGVGLWLKKKYKNFSAVLISGAMATSYFISYAAYNYYAIFSANITLGILLFITLLTVYFALNYNLQIIAHIGLVGAYVLPFIVSNRTENTQNLFIYISIINIGILILALKKYWKPLYYLSFISTWLIFAGWSFYASNQPNYFNIALIFSSVFFLIFYSISLLYKLLKKQKFNTTDVIILLANVFIYYGLVFRILDNHEQFQKYLGLFTISNAIIHLIVSLSIYKLRLADRNLFYLTAGLVLVFITVAIPVQLNGNSVTVLWAAEALVLFWIGRTRQTSFYERLSYPLMMIAFVSILDDWQRISLYDPSSVAPLTNNSFLSAMIVIVAFIAINYFHFNNRFEKLPFKSMGLNRFCMSLAPIFLIIILYITFRLEISNYYNHLYALSQDNLEVWTNSLDITNMNYSLIRLKHIWIINYSLLFMTVFSVINILSFKNRLNNKAILLANSIIILNFLTVGLIQFGVLREHYLLNENPFQNEYSFFYIRYISLILVLSLLIISKKISITINSKEKSKQIRTAYELFFHLSILWILSSELISWSEIAGFANNYKLSISILWSFYAILLVIIGIWKQKKHLRWAAIVLFAITIIKLFLYDLSHLPTISKTIIFLSTGLLLLAFSYLYNRFKNKIFSDNSNEKN